MRVWRAEKQEQGRWVTRISNTGLLEMHLFEKWADFNSRLNKAYFISLNLF